MHYFKSYYSAKQRIRCYVGFSEIFYASNLTKHNTEKLIYIIKGLPKNWSI